MTTMTPLTPSAALRAARKQAEEARTALGRAMDDLNPGQAVEAWHQSVETSRRIARLARTLGGSK